MSWIEAAVRPLADGLAALVFFEVPIADGRGPYVVLWLVAGAVFFTLRLRFVSVWGFWHGLELVLGRDSQTRPERDEHLRALRTDPGDSPRAGRLSRTSRCPTGTLTRIIHEGP